MTKLKKTYCILSLIFAIAVFVAVLFASQNRTTVYAASMDPDSIDSLDNTAANTSTGSGSESDSKGGLSISINNDEAGVASEVRALLLLTIIAVSPSLLIMLTFKNGNWNTDGTAKPDFDWTGIVFDIFYHVADVSADQ